MLLTRSPHHALDHARAVIQAEGTEHQINATLRALALALGADRAEEGTVNALRAVVTQIDKPELLDREAFTASGASKSNFMKWKRRCSCMSALKGLAWAARIMEDRVIATSPIATTRAPALSASAITTAALATNTLATALATAAVAAAALVDSGAAAARAGPAARPSPWLGVTQEANDEEGRPSKRSKSDEVGSKAADRNGGFA